MNMGGKNVYNTHDRFVVIMFIVCRVQTAHVLPCILNRDKNRQTLASKKMYTEYAFEWCERNCWLLFCAHSQCACLCLLNFLTLINWFTLAPIAV